MNQPPDEVLGTEQEVILIISSAFFLVCFYLFCIHMCLYVYVLAEVHM